MNKNAVYIAGPMEGLSKDEMTGWRNDFKRSIRQYEKPCGMVAEVIDPTRRQPFHVDDTEDRSGMIFKSDLMDIDNSAVVFFDLRRGKGYAWGTAMEAMYAWKTNKPLVVWTNKEDPSHPFIKVMATVVVHSLDKGVEAVASLLGMDKKDRAECREVFHPITPMMPDTRDFFETIQLKFPS